MPEKSKTKKVKVGTILDPDLYKRLKQRAAKEGRSVSEIFEDALRKYEHTDIFDRKLRLSALENLFSNKYNIGEEDWKAIMDEDYYDQ